MAPNACRTSCMNEGYPAVSSIMGTLVKKDTIDSGEVEKEISRIFQQAILLLVTTATLGDINL
ncbi:hypothetical protein N7530_007598 [Penicillium desertorum]|uniref:Uncharacterized protein n=1 Tax=Penicillium desertorum TaxID=1303715 RepID=A0A9X0BK32_9EURO|nr:hypothetical protein N7530_007598 [Penicillium desertorum]